jgi:putative glutamine amidotransferase
MNNKIALSKKPIIGITMRFNPNNRHLYLPAEYAAAIEYFGGFAVHLNLSAAGDYNQNAINFIDGILLPGGGDIDPLRFEEEPRIGLGTVSPLRDENDLMLLKYAEEMSVPVLGICYGMQLLNVFRGGSLFQDIEREQPNALNHQQGEPRERLSHWVEIAESSRALGALSNERVLVNSHHHQAVKRIGVNLRGVAVAGDGIVEAIEDTRPERFNLGVQWHPEISFERDRLSTLIFEQFIRAADNYRKTRLQS